MLKVHGLAKRFGKLKAIDDVSFSIGDGENNIPLGERYVYQSGCRVVNVTFDKNVGSITTIRNLGPGITCHAVIEVPGGKLPLQGNFPPTNYLLLL